MPHICCYITSHGLGHATRVLSVAAELLQQGTRITLVTTAPTFLTKDLVERFPKLISTRASDILDIAVIQADAITLDPIKTWKMQEEMYDAHHDIVCREADWLKQANPDLIYLDSPPYPALASNLADIPSVIVSNFTFDAILGPLAMTPKQNEIVSFFTSAYKKALGVIRLPGYIPIPAFETPETELKEPIDICNLNLKTKGFMVQSPLVVRPVQTSGQDVRKRLGVDGNDTKILFITFGGWFNLNGTLFQIEKLVPKDWIILTMNPLPIKCNDTKRIIELNPSTTYIPDIINASDVVLGKCGYGICSEVVSSKTPLLYISRTGFAEEAGLIRMVDQLGVEMPKDDYTSGNWLPWVMQAYDKRNLDTLQYESNGSLFVASTLLSLASIKD